MAPSRGSLDRGVRRNRRTPTPSKRDKRCTPPTFSGLPSPLFTNTPGQGHAWAGSRTSAYRCYRANSLSLLLTLSHYRNATDCLMPTFIGRREELLVLPRYAAALLFIIRNKLHETNLSCFSWPCMEWPSRLCVECDSILKAILIGSSDGLSQAFQAASNIWMWRKFKSVRIRFNTLKLMKVLEILKVLQLL